MPGDSAPLSRPHAAARPVRRPDGLARRVWLLRGLALLTVAALACSTVLWQLGRVPPRIALKLSAGDPLGRRYGAALAFQKRGESKKLDVELFDFTGSQAVADRVATGELDAGLVGGGVDPREGIAQAAALFAEPLHLLMRPELAPHGLAALPGRRLGLSTPESNTRRLALKLLDFLEIDVPAELNDPASYDELRMRADAELPDAVFVVSALPAPIVSHLVRERGFVLVEVPLAEALSLRHPSLKPSFIPRGTYRGLPPVPERDIETIASRTSVIVHANLSEDAVVRVMELLDDESFRLDVGLQGVKLADVVHDHEFPLHPGTIRYLERSRPMLDGEFVETLENLRSFLVSAVVAVILLWQWLRRRRAIGLERFLDEVTRLELEALALHREGRFDVQVQSRFQHELTEIKSDILEDWSSGRLSGETALMSFLAHLRDARTLIDGLAAAGSRSPSQAGPPRS